MEKGADEYSQSEAEADDEAHRENRRSRRAQDESTTEDFETSRVHSSEREEEEGELARSDDAIGVTDVDSSSSILSAISRLSSVSDVAEEKHVRNRGTSTDFNATDDTLDPPLPWWVTQKSWLDDLDTDKPAPVKLVNAGTEEVTVDTLHLQARQQPHRIERSTSSQQALQTSRTPRPPFGFYSRPKEQVLEEASAFFHEYAKTSRKKTESSYAESRITEVEHELKETGTFDLTPKELTYGTKLAWRNAPRCIARIQWPKLQVFDCRNVNTARGMFEALCRHLDFSTNNGRIQSAATVFRQRLYCPAEDRTHGDNWMPTRDFRIWNSSLIGYAGYRGTYGGVVGDPANVDFTEVCHSLGWRGKGTHFDVLPLVLVCDGMDPEWFDIPEHLVFRVHVKHPEYGDMGAPGMQWYALPAVSNMALDCAGLEFTAVVFSGWYMQTEVARNLLDPNRYNNLALIAKKTGLYNPNDPASLWQDRALLELNAAILHSFYVERATIVDHHTAAESFLKHYEMEEASRGGCPADWNYIVPPLAASTTPVYHQEMLCYQLYPAFEHQFPAWKHHVWSRPVRSKRDKSLRIRGLLDDQERTDTTEAEACSPHGVSATILYASDDDTSERYARGLQRVFRRAFETRISRLDQYDIAELSDESLILAVVSTRPNGGPPEQGEDFARELYVMGQAANEEVNQSIELLPSEDSPDTRIRKMELEVARGLLDREKPPPGSREVLMGENLRVLSNARYAVFGLGRSSFSKYDAFGKYLDTMFDVLGGERLVPFTMGDEIMGRTHAFDSWTRKSFQAADEAFRISDHAEGSYSSLDFDSGLSIKPGINAVFQPASEESDCLLEGLSKLHGRNVGTMRLHGRENLHHPEETFRTMRVDFDPSTDDPIFDGHTDHFSWEAGDLVGIFPMNCLHQVSLIESRLSGHPEKETPVSAVYESKSREADSRSGGSRSSPSSKDPEQNERDDCSRAVRNYPVATIRDYLTHYLDVTTPPDVEVLRILADGCSEKPDLARLRILISDSSAYREWRLKKNPTLADALEEFRSSTMEASRLLSSLPVLKPRIYSISSDHRTHGGVVQLTVADLRFHSKDGQVHRGICSSFLLHDLAPNGLVPCFHERDKFRVPSGSPAPLIMIGPGVGVAPFRAFWERRLEDHRRQDPMGCPDTFKGPLILYTGCRYRSCQLFRTEIANMITSGILSKVRVAVSRENGVPKTHVQDLVRSDAATILKQIIRDRGNIYVSGDSKMTETVYQTFVEILTREGRFDCDAAERYMLSMKGEGRYRENVYEISEHGWKSFFETKEWLSSGKEQKTEVRFSNQLSDRLDTIPSRFHSKPHGGGSRGSRPKGSAATETEDSVDPVAKVSAAVLQVSSKSPEASNLHVEKRARSPSVSMANVGPVAPETRADIVVVNKHAAADDPYLSPGTIVETTSLMTPSSAQTPTSRYKEDGSEQQTIAGFATDDLDPATRQEMWNQNVMSKEASEQKVDILLTPSSRPTSSATPAQPSSSRLGEESDRREVDRTPPDTKTKEIRDPDSDSRPADESADAINARSGRQRILGDSLADTSGPSKDDERGELVSTHDIPPALRASETTEVPAIEAEPAESDHPPPSTAKTRNSGKPVGEGTGDSTACQKPLKLRGAAPRCSAVITSKLGISIGRLTHGDQTPSCTLPRSVVENEGDVEKSEVEQRTTTAKSKRKATNNDETKLRR